MKIEGLFLRSRAGRRIFWTLLAAATIPIALFGALTHDALNDYFAAQSQRARVQAAKYIGMGLLDNLVVARTVLEIFARIERADTDSRIGNRRGRVLADVAAVDADGRWIAGSHALWTRWRGHLPPLPEAAGRDSARIVLGHHLKTGPTVPVLMVVHRAERPDRRWIGEIDADFLFGDVIADDAGQAWCVSEASGFDLYCPDRASAGDVATPAAGTPQRVGWNLFLRSDFGTGEWTISTPRAAGATDGAVEALALARTTALGTLATLLVVVMLSLVQVRRTMVPLERLISGTRRLARRDFGVRVRHDGRDEFGELAQSFNHMAEQLGRQVDALQVQSAIDREILNGLDVGRILQQVARRIEQLLPGALAAVIELDRSGRLPARVHHADGAATVINLTRADLPGGTPDADALHRLQPAPAWLRSALRAPAAGHHVQCARVGGSLLALVVVGLDDGIAPDADTRREIDELRDRVCVALASADRERLLVERATRDSLTGLANRSGLLEHLEHCLADPLAAPFSLMFADLDRFKEVNDALGHLAGDELLRAMARRLRDSAPAHALVARPGGDEFVVVVPGPRAHAEALADTLLARLAQPLAIEDRQIVVGSSIGLTHYPDDGRCASDLLRRADMAMYSAKARGGSRWSWFEPTLDAQLAQRTALLADLRQAIERREFELHYQPRVDVRRGAVLAAEALLRWRHPERGLVPPGRFIDLLEETGLIEPVGAWALDEACRQLAAWREQGLPLATLAVNVSTRQLQSPQFVEQVLAALRQHRLPPTALELEITESIFMADSSSAIAVVAALHAAGLRIALDDFGTGYSSLSYLQKLPIATLKVDRSFVVELGVRDSAMAVTRSIVALAQALRLQVVAEGVETPQQARLLIDLGCDELQGYLFARPMPAAEFASSLERGASLLAPLETTGQPA